MVFLKAKVFLLKLKEIVCRLEFYDYFHNPQTKNILHFEIKRWSD